MTTYPRTGKPYAGACRDCSGIGVPIQVSATVISLIVGHSEGCPFLASAIRKLDQEAQS